MDQIVSYSNIETVNDVVKTFASLPVTPIQDPDTGAIKFSIANFDSFYAMLGRITSEYDSEFIVTDMNVSAYEKDAASIKKLAEFIKKGANEFVMAFAKDLVGVTKGKNRYDGQVQVCEKLLMKAYDAIHKKTVAFREEKKRLESSEEAEPAEFTEVAPSNFTAYIVSVPNSDIEEFEAYIKSKGYQARKETN